jgi:acyl carrier protein
MDLLIGESLEKPAASRVGCAASFATHKEKDMTEKNMEAIKEKVIDIVASQMEVDRAQIKMETSFVDDLGADSLDIAELVMEFEDEFDLNIPDEEDSIRSVGDAVKYIFEHI